MQKKKAKSTNKTVLIKDTPLIKPMMNKSSTKGTFAQNMNSIFSALGPKPDYKAMKEKKGKRLFEHGDKPFSETDKKTNDYIRD